MALTFFTARRSLAAASAEGEAGLSGAGCWPAGCCARAGRAENAKPSARPVASKILDRPFIFQFSLIAALPPLNNTNSPRAGQHCHAGKANEQPVLDNTRNGNQRLRQARRVRYASEMG